MTRLLCKFQLKMFVGVNDLGEPFSYTVAS
jgi:hypothetical protein